MLAVEGGGNGSALAQEKVSTSAANRTTCLITPPVLGDPTASSQRARERHFALPERRCKSSCAPQKNVGIVSGNAVSLTGPPSNRAESISQR
jgi:hypothetical protein